MKTFNIKVSKYFSGKTQLGEVLQKVTNLAPEKISDAAEKGAVWYQKGGKGKITRIRSAQSLVDPQDSVTFYYEPKVLGMKELTEAQCLFECSHYGVWIKAAGIMPQGTQAGDHTALLRYVEKLKKKEVYLVHRLDRETQGLMLIGYTSEAAAKLSALFQKNLIKKTYQTIVLGELPLGQRKSITDSLDGKEAITHFEVLASEKGMSKLEVKIETGRLHQIRRHLEFIGHPVMGDPKYGKGNKNREGLKLLAKSLSFQDPWEKKNKDFVLDTDLTF